MSSYAEFLDRKSQLGGQYGFDPSWVPDWLFDFQRAMVEWACRKGRAALFEDCGLGKTAQQLVWMENVHRRTGRPVLMVAPLAVSGQTIEEAAKFGLEVRRTQDGSVHAGLNVTNYERLHLFSPSDWAGCACDESSAIKSFDGTLGMGAELKPAYYQQAVKNVETALVEQIEQPELALRSESESMD